MNDKHLIDPQNLPTWTAAGFIVALLALVIAFVGFYRTNVVVLATQTQIFALNKKIEDLSRRTPAPAPAAAAVPAPASK